MIYTNQILPNFSQMPVYKYKYYQIHLGPHKYWDFGGFFSICEYQMSSLVHDVFGDTFKDVTGDVIIKLIVRQVYHYFNFKFFEVFRIRVLVFISIYSFDNTFKDSNGEVIMNLIVRQVYHYSNFKFVEVFSVQVKFSVF